MLYGTEIMNYVPGMKAAEYLRHAKENKFKYIIIDKDLNATYTNNKKEAEKAEISFLIQKKSYMIYDRSTVSYVEHTYVREEDLFMLIFDKSDTVDKRIKGGKTDIISMQFPVLIDKETGKLLKIFMLEFSKYGNLVELDSIKGFK